MHIDLADLYVLSLRKSMDRSSPGTCFLSFCARLLPSSTPAYSSCKEKPWGFSSLMLVFLSTGTSSLIFPGLCFWFLDSFPAGAYLVFLPFSFWKVSVSLLPQISISLLFSSNSRIFDLVRYLVLAEHVYLYILGVQFQDVP